MKGGASFCNLHENPHLYPNWGHARVRRQGYPAMLGLRGTAGPSLVPQPNLRRRPVMSSASADVKSQSSEGARAPANGRLPWFETLEQYRSPVRYYEKVLKGNDMAYGEIFGQDTLFIAEPNLARAVLAPNEDQVGVAVAWPQSFKDMLGGKGVSFSNGQEHRDVRALMSPYFTPDAVNRMLPNVQAVAQEYLQTWQASGTFPAAVAAKNFTFNILANLVLQLNLSAEEVAEYSQQFKILVEGFVPPAIDLPFLPYGRGLRARRIIVERIKKALDGPLSDGLMSKLRDTLPREEVIDNAVNIMFAGHDTSSSVMVKIFGFLAEQPLVLDKVRQEQLEMVAAHGSTITPASIAAAPYTSAVVKETLRLSNLVPGSPRVATKDLALPGGYVAPAGCPVLVAYSAMTSAHKAAGRAVTAGLDSEEGSSSSSGVDPWEDFNLFIPERWLGSSSSSSRIEAGLRQAAEEGGEAASTSAAVADVRGGPIPREYHPFGMGQRYCLGWALATAELTVMLSELARSYSLEADTNTSWMEYPILAPKNGLPTRLKPL